MVVIKDGCRYFYADALHGGVCERCGARLIWKPIFNSESHVYSTSCCGRLYRLRPGNFIASVQCDDTLPMTQNGA